MPSPLQEPLSLALPSSVSLAVIFDACADKLGVPPAACAVIEDSTHGLKGARAAGMIAIGLVGTCTVESLEPHADCVVGSLHELSPSRISELIRSRP